VKIPGQTDTMPVGISSGLWTTLQTLGKPRLFLTTPRGKNAQQEGA